MDYPNENSTWKNTMNTLAAQQFRLTDSLERDMLLNAFDQQATARPVQALMSALRAVGRGFGAFFAFIDEVNETMNRAAQQNARFSGAQW